MKLIVFEGVNAAGKTSIAAHMKSVLLAAGHSCLTIDPAGFGQIGKTIRKNIVHPEIKSTPNFDTTLFAALRIEGAARILEAVQSDPSVIILLERWSLALAAYGAADGARPQLIAELREVLQGTLTVDMTVLFDVSGEVAYKRIGKDAADNRFESKGPKYLDNVAHWYRHYSALENDVTVVDATGDLISTYRLLRAALVAKWKDLDSNL
jgi:dTMP kinase